MRHITVLAATAAIVAGIAAAIAQDAVVRTPLQKSDFPGAEHATHMMVVTVAAGGVVGAHTHPGIEMGYVQEGEAVMSIAGQPDRTLKAGDSYLIPAGAVHSAKNVGTTPIKIVATFVVDKSKPLASPASK